MMATIKLILLSTVIVATTSVVQDKSLFNINPDMNISEPVITKTMQKLQGNGLLKGMRACGGKSHATQWRFDSCLDSDAICHVPTDGVIRTFQLDFAPSQDIARLLGVRFHIQSSDGEINFVHDYGPVTPTKLLNARQIYTISGAGIADSKMRGKHVTAQYIVYDVADNDVEVCAEADVQYV